MFKSRGYKSAYRQEDFPVAVKVGKPIYLEAKASGDGDIQLMVDICLASHSENARQKPNYMFIDNG